MKRKAHIGLVGSILLLALVAITATASADEHTINGQTGSLNNHEITGTDTIFYNPGTAGTTYFKMNAISGFKTIQKQAKVEFYWCSNASPNWTRWTTNNFYNSMSVKLYSGSPDVKYKIVINKVIPISMHVNIAFTNSK